jgi:hypothetical protein
MTKLERWSENGTITIVEKSKNIRARVPDEPCTFSVLPSGEPQNYAGSYYIEGGRVSNQLAIIIGLF